MSTEGTRRPVRSGSRKRRLPASKRRQHDEPREEELVELEDIGAEPPAVKKMKRKKAEKSAEEKLADEKADRIHRENTARIPIRKKLEISVNDQSEFYSLRRGEFLMIRGPSGGGKTTLLNMIGTIDKPTNGTVRLFGEEVDQKSSDNYLSDLRLKKIGFVFQTFNLIATMSAYENVELPMTLLSQLSAKQRRRRTKRLLKMVGLEDRMNHLPAELSGGEQQRVTIARALANDPCLLLLDEPTGDLDIKNTIEIMDLILRINLKHRTTCVMVTHNPDLECYADRICYVKDGRFEKQAINQIQCPIVHEDYLEWLRKVHDQ